MATIPVAFFLATFQITFAIPEPWTPEVDPALRCPYGRHHSEIGNQANCNLLGVSCTEGYFCSGDTKDKNGRCCKTHNPCTTGSPYHVRGDAPACMRGDYRCPRGYTCVGTAYSSSVCCPGSEHSGHFPRPSNPGLGCIADGGLYQFGEVFYNINGDRCTCQITGVASCIPNTHRLPSGGSRFCTMFDRSYRPGQRFVASDGCNECECFPDGQIQCGNQPCPQFAIDRRHGTPGQLYCTFESIHYSRGQTFTSTDGCRQCSCGNSGRVHCQPRPCNGFPDQSEPYPIGGSSIDRPFIGGSAHGVPHIGGSRFPSGGSSAGFPRGGGSIGFPDRVSPRGGDHGHDHGHSHK